MTKSNRTSAITEEEAIEELNFTIDIYHDRNATVAHLSWTEGVPTWEQLDRYYTGSAKRERFDRGNRTIARNLAMARAMESLVRELKREANRLIDENCPEPKPKTKKPPVKKAIAKVAKKATTMISRADKPELEAPAKKAPKKTEAKKAEVVTEAKKD